MQVMGKLPEERLKPSPPWYNTAIDLFGPFKIRDEVKLEGELMENVMEIFSIVCQLVLFI